LAWDGTWMVHFQNCLQQPYPPYKKMTTVTKVDLKRPLLLYLKLE
jgi:hypothetical protein